MREGMSIIGDTINKDTEWTNKYSAENYNLNYVAKAHEFRREKQETDGWDLVMEGHAYHVHQKNKNKKQLNSQEPRNT